MSVLQEAKLILVEAMDLGKDALHIYVGLTVFFASAALFRWRVRDWRPLLAVLIVALAGEAWDLIDSFAEGQRPVYARNWKDVWNTMFWPSAIFLLARYTRLLRR